jgi:putative addiction module CopG family antidote
MSQSPKSTIDVPEQVRRFAQSEVDSGRYESLADVFVDAFDALQFREKLQAFQAEVDAGIAELDAGNYAEGSASHFTAALREKRPYSEL